MFEILGYVWSDQSCKDIVDLANRLTVTCKSTATDKSCWVIERNQRTHRIRYAAYTRGKWFDTYPKTWGCELATQARLVLHVVLHELLHIREGKLT